MAKIIYRDAESGEIVTQEYAEANRATTVRETIRERFTRNELAQLQRCLESCVERGTHQGMNHARLLDRVLAVRADTPPDA